MLAENPEVILCEWGIRTFETFEVHHKPEEALSDDIQALAPPQFRELIEQCRELAKVAGKRFL